MVQGISPVKITKTQLRQIIKEEVQKEAAAFGTTAAPIGGTSGLSFSGSRTSGRSRLSGSPEPEEQYPKLARMGPQKQQAITGAFRKFVSENDKLSDGQKLSDEEMKKIQDKLYKDPPFGGLQHNDIYKRTLAMLQHKLSKS